MELIHISIVSAIVLLNIIFAVRVVFVDRKNPVNRSFALFTFFVALWLFTDFLCYQFRLAEYQTSINRINLVVVVWLMLSIALFVTLFPRPILRIKNYIWFLVAVYSLLLSSVIIFTNMVVKNAFVESYGSNFNQGSLFVLFAASASVFLIYAMIVLAIKYFRFKDEEKRQVKYILFGIAIFLVFNVVFNLLVPVMTDSFVYGRFGSYSVIFLVGFIAYAILKTHLFNLRVILTETAAVIIDVVLAVQIFTSHSALEGLLRALLAIIVFYGSYLLIRSVREEIKRREELQVLSEELKVANQKLQAIDAMKTEFVSMASHELLTPISAIEGYLSMMLDEKMVKIDDPKAVEYMSRVYKSAKRLARLVADLLNVSRIEEGRLLVEKQDIELEETITSVINELKFKAEAAKVTLESEIPDEARVKIYADPDKIKEVIINLVGNSIKYNHKGGHVKVKAGFLPMTEILENVKRMESICAEENKDVVGEGSIQSAIHEKYREPVGDRQLLISVQDDGIGIEKCDVGRLFKKFSRVGDWSTQETPGTGLGLYISKSLIEMHHGRIWAESEGKDKGSTFHFSLPLYEAKEQVVKLDEEVPKAKDAKPLAKSAVGN